MRLELSAIATARLEKLLSRADRSADHPETAPELRSYHAGRAKGMRDAMILPSSELFDKMLRSEREWKAAKAGTRERIYLEGYSHGVFKVLEVRVANHEL